MSTSKKHIEKDKIIDSLLDKIESGKNYVYASFDDNRFSHQNILDENVRHYIRKDRQGVFYLVYADEENGAFELELREILENLAVDSIENTEDLESSFYERFPSIIKSQVNIAYHTLGRFCPYVQELFSTVHDYYLNGRKLNLLRINGRGECFLVQKGMNTEIGLKKLLESLQRSHQTKNELELSDLFYSSYPDIDIIAVSENTMIFWESVKNQEYIVSILIEALDEETYDWLRKRIPDNLQDMVLPLSFYQQVIHLQKEALERILSQINVLPLSFLVSMGVPCEIISHIQSFDSRFTNELHTQLMAVPLPISPSYFTNYEKRLEEKVNSMLSIMKDTMQPQNCISKLRGYVSTLEQFMSEKKKLSPSFFDNNLEIKAEKEEEMCVAKKTIDWLHGDEEVTFSNEEIIKLSNGTLGSIFKRFDLEPNALPQAISTVVPE